MKTAIAAAIVDRDKGLILMSKREQATTYPLHWCAPGGKPEGQESWRQALDRELREEIHVALKPDFEPQHIVYQEVVKSLRTGEDTLVICYHVPYTEIVGTPQCGHKTIGVAWCTPDELRTMLLTPGDAAHREEMITSIAW